MVTQSLKRKNVFLNDYRKFDVENTSQRKQKSTDIFAPMTEEEIVHKPSLKKQKSTNVLAPMAGEEFFTNHSLVIDLFVQMVKSQISSSTQITFQISVHKVLLPIS